MTSLEILLLCGYSIIALLVLLILIIEDRKTNYKFIDDTLLALAISLFWPLTIIAIITAFSFYWVDGLGAWIYRYEIKLFRRK